MTKNRHDPFFDESTQGWAECTEEESSWQKSPGPYTYTLNDEVEINNSNTIEPDEDIKDSTKSYIWSPLEDIINYEDIDDDMHTLYNTQCTCVEDFLEKSIERKKIKVTHLLSSMVTKQQDSMVSMDTNPCDIESIPFEVKNTNSKRQKIDAIKTNKGEKNFTVKIVSDKNVFKEDMPCTPVFPIYSYEDELNMPRGTRFYYTNINKNIGKIISEEEFIKKNTLYNDEDDSGIKYLQSVQEEAEKLPFSLRAEYIDELDIKDNNSIDIDEDTEVSEINITNSN